MQPRDVVPSDPGQWVEQDRQLRRPAPTRAGVPRAGAPSDQAGEDSLTGDDPTCRTSLRRVTLGTSGGESWGRRCPLRDAMARAFPALRPRRLVARAQRSLLTLLWPGGPRSGTSGPGRACPGLHTAGGRSCVLPGPGEELAGLFFGGLRLPTAAPPSQSPPGVRRQRVHWGTPTCSP